MSGAKDERRSSTRLSVDLQVAIVERALYEGIEEDPAMEVTTSQGWFQAVGPGLSSGLLRRVYRSVLSPQEADTRIAEVVAAHQTSELPTMWVVGPGARPSDLGERLLAAGFRLSHVATGLIAEVQRLSVQPSPEVSVEPVGEDNLEAWIHVHATGWSMVPSAVARLRESARARITASARRSVDLLARIGGEPAGIGSIVFGQRFACLRNGVVLPEHRRKGVFRSLVAARIAVLKERGVPVVAVHAMKETSAPLYRSMRFDPVCDLTSYLYS